MVKASSWEEAKSKAKTFVLAVGRFLPTDGGTYERQYEFVIPKDTIGVNTFVQSGYYNASNNYELCQMYLGTTLAGYTQGNIVAAHNGTARTVTQSFYYDA